MAWEKTSRSLSSQAHKLFRKCVQCPQQTPSCPVCAANEVCSFNLGDGCTTCASNICIPSPSTAKASNSGGSSPAGPIAGGVIGGVILFALAFFLFNRFYLKPKRTRWTASQMESYNKEQMQSPEDNNETFAEQRSKRASTHTVASVRTNGSRASIPIAYIPGVITSRSDANSPDIIPPVPPIPAHGGSAPGTLSPRMNTGTEMFFRPDSSYADHGDYDRRSLAGRSTRSSVASELHKVMDPMPAHAAVAARATPISLKSRSSNSRLNSPNRSPTATPPPLSHQNSIAGRMQGPITGQSGQARQIVITRSQSNLRGTPTQNMNTIAELDDTSTGILTPRMMASELDDTSVGSQTPRLPIDRSGTASPRSMLSDDAEDLMSQGRWRRPSAAGPTGLGAAELRGSSVSGASWDPQAMIRNTIQNATSIAYSNQMNGNGNNNNNAHDSPFADRHATNGL